MKQVVGKWIPLVVATAAGVVSLAGYLVPGNPLAAYRDQLVEWAVVLAAFALIFGTANLLRFHARRVFSSEQGWFYSLVLIISASVAWIPALLRSPGSPMTQAVSDYVIVPLGAALAALLAFTLTWSAMGLLRHRRNASSVLFIVIVTLSLLGSTPLLGIEWLADVHQWLIQVPGMAGFRGLLLGVALGTLITGLRVLLGTERPHSES